MVPRAVAVSLSHRPLQAPVGRGRGQGVPLCPPWLCPSAHPMCPSTEGPGVSPDSSRSCPHVPVPLYRVSWCVPHIPNISIPGVLVHPNIPTSPTSPYWVSWTLCHIIMSPVSPYQMPWCVTQRPQHPHTGCPSPSPTPPHPHCPYTGYPGASPVSPCPQCPHVPILGVLVSPPPYRVSWWVPRQRLEQ